MGVVQWPDVFVLESAIPPVVSVDWMAFSCVLPREWSAVPSRLPAGWRECECSGTAVWERRSIVYDADGNKVCTILGVPKSGIIDARRVVLQVANRWLYYDDWEDIFCKCLEIKGLAVTGLNRVDLCGDFEMTAERWETYWRLGVDEAYLKGLKMGRKDWRTMNGVRFCNQLSWGSPQSVFKWKVYYKWLEIASADEDERKEYILDLWKRNGMREKAVWRCEVSITDVGRLADDALKTRLKPFDWMRQRVSIWEGLVSSKFVVRLDEHHADRRHDAVLPFLQCAGERRLVHALSSSSRDDSSPERRVAVKLWSELMRDDVRADAGLYQSLRGMFLELMERPTVVDAVCRVSKMGVAEIEHALS